MYCAKCIKLEAENANLKRQLEAAGEFAIKQMNARDQVQAECDALKQRMAVVLYEPLAFDA